LSNYVDLHCHSTASDGRLTPAQLVERAKTVGLRALALTDHDTVAGVSSFQAAARATGLEAIAGVEVSADYEKGTMHIVGLYVDAQSQSFRAFLKHLADGRKVRNPQIVEQLNNLGMAISMGEVEQEANQNAADAQEGLVEKSIGRPHIAAVMIKRGYVKTKQEAFERFLAKGKPAYISRFSAAPDECIKQIHTAGGLAILAHPSYLNAADDTEMTEIIGELKGNGLDGIEVFYSTHSRNQTALCLHLAEKFDLLQSGGSDFHGEPGRGGTSVELGSGINNSVSVDYAVLEKIKARLRR